MPKTSTRPAIATAQRPPTIEVPVNVRGAVQFTASGLFQYVSTPPPGGMANTWSVPPDQTAAGCPPWKLLFPGRFGSQPEAPLQCANAPPAAMANTSMAPVAGENTAQGAPATKL